MAKRTSSLAEKHNQRWQQQLNNRIPLVGGWLRQEAARLLKQAAIQGNPQAMNTLALAYATTRDSAVKKLAREAMESAERHSCVDAIWMAWIATRSGELLQILLEKNWVASAPPQARLYSALRLSKMELITKGGSEIIPYLIDACEDANPDLAASAHSCLSRLENQHAVDALCDLWVQKRSSLLEEAVRAGEYLAQSPPLAVVYTALVNHHPELITGGGSEIVDPLLHACADPDLKLRAEAKNLIGKLLNPAAIDALCAVWAEKRDAWIGDLISTKNYVAREPARTRFLSAVRCSQIDLVARCAPQDVETILDLAQADPDPDIRMGMGQALMKLANPETRDALCRAAAEKENSLAGEITLDSGFVPSKPEERALFYFMLGRWEEYETLDFDRRLMQAVYSTASLELRRRITRKLQRSGRSDFTSVLTAGIQTRIKEMTAEEIEPLVNLLRSHQQWDQLWELSLGLSLFPSTQIVRLLRDNSWSPQTPLDCATFETLVGLLEMIPVQKPGEWLNVYPPNLPSAKIRISGRVNDVAISPVRPIVALAGGNKKLVLWNFQKSQVEKIVGGFDHSIGKVAFTSEGTLLCSERASRNSDLCGIYTLDGDQLARLGSHRGSVTAFEPAGTQRAVSTGKDGKIFLWDISSRKIISEKYLHFWPRAAKVSPDGTEVVLLDRSVAFVSLPDLAFIKKRGYPVHTGDGYGGVSRCAAYLPGAGGMILGKSNGRVLIFQSTANERKMPAGHSSLDLGPSEIQGIEILERQNLIITAVADGEIKYFHWPEKNLIGSAKTSGERLTSLSLSPDGAFMASGDSGAALYLWGLQSLDLPGLVLKPLSLLTQKEFATIHALASDGNLTAEIQACARYMQTVFQHRTRYDIQLDEVRTIQAGEFDIMID